MPSGLKAALRRSRPFLRQEHLVVTASFSARSARRPSRVHIAVVAWDGEVPDTPQRVALAVVARRRSERLARSSASASAPSARSILNISAVSRDYHARPKTAVTSRVQCVQRGGRHIKHFWGGEMNVRRPIPDRIRAALRSDAIWTILDTTPRARADWYPS